MKEALDFTKWLLSDGIAALPWALFLGSLVVLYKMVTAHIKTLKETSTAGHGWSATIESLEASFTSEIGRLNARIDSLLHRDNEINDIVKKARAKRQQ